MSQCQLDQVIGAIDTFYAPTTPSQLRQKTGKSLESFQNTVKTNTAEVAIVFKLFFRFTPGMPQ